MKTRYLLYILSFALAAASCQKNNVSKIPQIGLIYFGPDVAIYKKDTPTLEFSITDGDGDLGNDPGSGQYDIYIKDFRFDTGYTGYYFPAIDRSIEDPKKGLTGTCIFEFTPDIFTYRDESLHNATGDTTKFAFYIMDRAGHHSDTLYTKSIIIRP